MTVKTITVTEIAYNALKGLQTRDESFSETILRVARKKSIWDFAGAISKGRADRMEKIIRERRKSYTKMHGDRVQRIAKALEGR